jgi:hypothetical protein
MENARVGTDSRCRGTNVYRVFPWVHQYVNNLHPEHQTHGVSFPDINPADLPPNAQFSMAAGDFLEVWKCLYLIHEPTKWFIPYYLKHLSVNCKLYLSVSNLILFNISGLSHKWWVHAPVIKWVADFIVIIKHPKVINFSVRCVICENCIICCVGVHWKGWMGLHLNLLLHWLCQQHCGVYWDNIQHLEARSAFLLLDLLWVFR